MKITNYLFFDASFPTAIGQVGTAERYQEHTFETRQDLAAHQTRLVDRMLDAAHLSFDQLDLIGVGVGPGSLTGLRMAVGFFRTLARFGNKPLLGVSLFDWAAKTLEHQGHTGKVRITLPGPLKGQFVAELVLPVAEPVLQTQIRFCSAEAFAREANAFAVGQHVANCPRLDLDASALDEIMRTYIPTAPDDLLKVVPLYVIPSQAEINWEKRAASC